MLQSTSERKNDSSFQQERRRLLSDAFMAASAFASLSLQPNVAYASEATMTAIKNPTQLSASWSATSGLNTLDPNDPNFVSFDASAYAAMRDDPSRTPVFKKSLEARLRASPPLSQVVLDLGTGPFALFAIIAAELGAAKVYAIEANPAVAENARQTIQKQGWEDVITVLEGFSTDITLPEQIKADIIVAEVVGSIATEESVYATILDAHRRLAKNPGDARNWIPSRIQTWAAPASYTLHNLFRPPEFDWTKIAAEPVRFNCRDVNLALLDTPQCVEDIVFADIAKTNIGSSLKTTHLSFVASGERMQEASEIFFDEYRKGKLPKQQAMDLAETAGHSCSGMALWPRLFLPFKEGEDLVINSRSHPEGSAQRSHWQTVLPIMAATPATGIQDGDKIEVNCRFETPSSVTDSPKYSITANVVYT